MGLKEPDVLQQLREATEKEDMSVMRSAPEQGQFMAMLLRLSGAQRVLEIGTYTGYATLWMALALPDDGEIVSCDVSEQWTNLARHYWAVAGLDRKIHLYLRPALETLQALLKEGEQGRFDFVFIDADKFNHCALKRTECVYNDWKSSLYSPLYISIAPYHVPESQRLLTAPCSDTW